MSSIRASRPWAGLMHLLRLASWAIPERAYRHLWFQGRFGATVNGTRIKMVHPGSVLDNELFWRNNFEGERTAVAAAGDHIDRAEAFLDVGANTGFYSLYAKARNPRLVVLAFEPSPINFDLLRQNIALNGYDIAALEAAVTDKDGDVTLYDFATHSYSASLVEGFREGSVARSVPGFTLDTIAEKHNLLGKKLLIKVDVEGHESAVLAGAARVIAAAPTLLIEILSDEAARALFRHMPADRFSYTYANEASGRMEDVTSDILSGGSAPSGNYFVVPLNGA
jgi:FkbM family methyltransferase